MTESDTPRDEWVTAFGSVTGVVRLLAEGGGLAVVVTDDTSGVAVPCRLDPDASQAAIDALRGISARRAVVEGIVVRALRKGHPLAVLDVERVTLAPEPTPGAFPRARGVIVVADEIEPPEATIRRLRDAGQQL